ncbi:hypothetical protein BGZ61DRAFT_17510 [Ilyonectria robusta]|uniref:uncharacterized protein n=1 Tax=Ilyonectria robusta TaxID=1079257 RepID=UPI001E8DD8D4|nr:uncharacterized protein BGZ61DRAFT_17510 [Ilyonectria robusta]KAH8737529.1 hypothetical protein BGZ61DRAFT_17510 [Ilyonectria robusta]
MPALWPRASAPAAFSWWHYAPTCQPVTVTGVSVSRGGRAERHQQAELRRAGALLRTLQPSASNHLPSAANRFVTLTLAGATRWEVRGCHPALGPRLHGRGGWYSRDVKSIETSTLVYLPFPPRLCVACAFVLAASHLSSINNSMPPKKPPLLDLLDLFEKRLNMFASVLLQHKERLLFPVIRQPSLHVQ